ELYCDFAGAMRKRFPGAQIEGHAGPAPIFHEAFERDKGFRRGIRMGPLLTTIAWDGNATGRALTVLGTDGDVLDILIGNGPEAAEDFHLCVAYHVRIERVGGLHCDQAK